LRFLIAKTDFVRVNGFLRIADHQEGAFFWYEQIDFGEE